MQARLAHQSYGKSRVRLTKVTRRADRHELAELSIDIALEGDFAASYLTGDNRQVIATDTMKNTVYVLAADHPLDSPESFALTLAEHFVRRNAHVSAATVNIEEPTWRRIDTLTGVHPHAFVAGGPQRRTCRVRHEREKTTVRAGVAGLSILKTTNSAFRGFLRDEFTTLPETDDRIFATTLDANWLYRPGSGNWNAAHAVIVQALLDVFAGHVSLAVQQTLFAMGQAALAACDAIDEIHLAMPNQHRIPVNLAPFGLPSRNEIFVTTSEPFGLIEATLARDAT
ncbi:MAG: urate oxidase [Pirellulaceae bacterium]|nr:urate oxidase [Pirellulaceae bacterium]